MQLGLVSQAAFSPKGTLEAVSQEAQECERLGFGFLSLPHAFGIDALTALALAGPATTRVELATGVVPTPPRHPTALAQQALSTQAACAGRLVLGIGLSHKIVIEDMFGLSYARPAAQMRDYLEILMPLVRGEAADWSGEIYSTHAGLSVPGASPIPVLVAALGPRMLDVAGRLADGTATWMTGPKTLANHIAPRIRDAAKSEGRAEPRIVAALPIALAANVEDARTRAGEAFAMYGTLPSYRAMLDLEGAAGPGDVAIIGDEAVLRAGLAQLREAGVTHFAASCVDVEPGARDRTLEFLASEA